MRRPSLSEVAEVCELNPEFVPVERMRAAVTRHEFSVSAEQLIPRGIGEKPALALTEPGSPRAAVSPGLSAGARRPWP